MKTLVSLVKRLFGISSRSWTLSQAVDFVRSIDPVLRKNGFGVGITGSNLTKGNSNDDLDIIVYPLSTINVDQKAAAYALRYSGLRLKHPHTEVQSHWRAKGSLDTKRVEVWTVEIGQHCGKRVDVFFLQ